MKLDQLQKLINWILWPAIGATGLTIGVLILSLYLYINPTAELLSDQSPTVKMESVVDVEVKPEIIDGIHVSTGLKSGDGLEVVVTNCTNCHSAKLIIQNRMTAERWRHTIHWMQRTQNLWDLGPNEDIIVSYLATHYAPEKKGRRARLTNIDWYVLEE